MTGVETSTHRKWMPYVRPEHKDAVDAFWRAQTARRKRARRQIGGGGQVAAASLPMDNNNRCFGRYPEVRGLRSLKGEDNRTIYVNRDKSAATIIAQLLAWKLLAGKKARPSQFCRPGFEPLVVITQ